MEWRRLARRFSRWVGDLRWWVTISPFCVWSDLPRLGARPDRPLTLGDSSDQYPTSELIGRLWAFRGRIRFARALLILPRSLVICGLILLVARATQILSQRPPSTWLFVSLFLILGWALHLTVHHEIPSFEVARLVDRRMGLHAQLATAVEYTLRQKFDQPLVRTQVRLATGRLRELDPEEVVPLVWPRGEARALAAIVVLYGALSLVGNLGLNLPRTPQPIDVELATLANQQAQAPTQYVTVNANELPTQLQPATASGQVPQQLKTLEQELKSQAITPAEYQARLQQLQKQLQEQASASLAAQQALNALAAAFKDSSTTRAISDSLARGDYQSAANQINDLSQQIEKLSPDAQAELASRLANASQQTERLSPTMSDSARQASDALRQGNSAQASQSLQSLAQSVQQASSQIQSQAQLGQALQQIQQNLGNQQGDGQNARPSSNEASGSPSDAGRSAEASGPAGTAADPSQQFGTGPAGAPSALDQQADSGAPGSLDRAGSRTGQPAVSQQIQQAGSNNGGAGSAPGSRLLDSKPTPLDVGGVKLTITGRASSTGNDQTQAGDRSMPLTGADGSTIAGSGGAARDSSNVPINVHQESNVVPLELKPVVRDYFSNAGS